MSSPFLSHSAKVSKFFAVFTGISFFDFRLFIDTDAVLDKNRRISGGMKFVGVADPPVYEKGGAAKSFGGKVTPLGAEAMT
jgi:hypothetical protein